MNILAISDKVEELIYSPASRTRFEHVDLVVSCGDLPFYYLEYVISTLNAPMVYVFGNHHGAVEYNKVMGEPRTVAGAINLDGQVINHQGLLIAGLEGCRRYNGGAHQYTDAEMRMKMLKMMPMLLWNKLRHGRYLDLLVTHAPPRGIHDQEDLPHQGFESLLWFLRTFQPRWHWHGHIHVYSNRTVTQTLYEETEITNVYGYREFQIQVTHHAVIAPVTEEQEVTNYGVRTTDSGRF